MRNYLVISMLFLIQTILPAQKTNPSFEEVLSLPNIGNPHLSPDGTDVLFQVNQPDWENNRYDTEIWISRDGNDPVPLTNSDDGSSGGPSWSPNGKYISFTRQHDGKSQLYLMPAEGGAAFRLTHAASGVQDYEWSPASDKIAFTMDADEKKEEREKRYGAFQVEDNEYGRNKLYLIELTADILSKYPLPGQLEDSLYKEKRKGRVLVDKEGINIGGFEWSPDGKKIAVNHNPNSNILSFLHSDISIFDIEKDTLLIEVDNPSSDALIAWSPDGRQLLYTSSLSDSTSNFYMNTKLFRKALGNSEQVQLGKDFDEDLYNIHWTPEGIYAIAQQKTESFLVSINQDNGKISMITNGPGRLTQVDFATDGKRMAWIGQGATQLSELYLADDAAKTPKKVTNFSAVLNNWEMPASEVIRWKSRDGTEIEGVLTKPADYDPRKKYPLLVVIHGGPTGISTPSPAYTYVYPIVNWANKGALILQPNYRGSAGYGEKFRSLNVRNLGVGDAWDVLSGVDYLEKEGMIDGSRVGAMGWSQGGYISAFLTTTSDKFKAISVGAGISNWMTYYVNTDIHPFTRQYLQATPWSDKEIYEKTSPMTFINDAKTPTLIQHGEFDQRVPIPNAYELYQGLQDVGVPARLIVYKGFGHGITKPKERLAAVWHNWQWFGKYIWGEEVELPLE